MNNTNMSVNLSKSLNTTMKSRYRNQKTTGNTIDSANTAGPRLQE